MESWELSQHLLLDTGKLRKTCVEVAGRRTFRILTSSQQFGMMQVAQFNNHRHGEMRSVVLQMTIYNNKKNSYTVTFCRWQQLSVAVTDDYIYCDLLFEIFECFVTFNFILSVLQLLETNLRF